MLARAGRDVVVVDKAVFPRDKCCGDGLTTLALRELELLGFDPGAVADWQVVDGAVLRSPSGRQVRVPLPPGPGTFAAVAPRLQLDDALVDVAVKAGATVLQGHGFDGTIDERGDHVVARRRRPRPDRGALRRRRRRDVEPGAQGARRRPDPATSASGTPSASTSATSTAPAAHDLFVWFDADLLPGYAWSFPLPGGRANVGFGVLRDGTRRIQDMKAMWAGLLDRPHVRAALGPRAPGSRAATRRGRSRPASTPRTLASRPRAARPATRRWPPT